MTLTAQVKLSSRGPHHFNIEVKGRQQTDSLTPRGSWVMVCPLPNRLKLHWQSHDARRWGRANPLAWISNLLGDPGVVTAGASCYKANPPCLPFRCSATLWRSTRPLPDAASLLGTSSFQMCALNQLLSFVHYTGSGIVSYAAAEHELRHPSQRCSLEGAAPRKRSAAGRSVSLLSSDHSAPPPAPLAFLTVVSART